MHNLVLSRELDCFSTIGSTSLMLVAWLLMLSPLRMFLKVRPCFCERASSASCFKIPKEERNLRFKQL
jgi:hypothetical protein